MDIINYEGLYKIYSNGDVLGLKRNKFLKPFKNTIGYLQVELWKDGKGKKFLVHRLQGIHFIPNPENKSCIDHINRDKLDNRIENLRWATHEENMSNKSIYKNNKLGHQYICYHKLKKKFRFSIERNKVRHIKDFKTLEEAIEYKKNYIN